MHVRALMLWLAVAACGHDHGHDHDHGGGHGGHAESSAGGHSHDPRHGGVLIALGDEVAHVEVALEPASGRVRAWLYDHEVRPLRTDAGALVLAIDGGPKVELVGVASSLTGETAGDTSCFEGLTEALIGAREFQGTLQSIPVLGREFEAVSVQWAAAE